MRFTIPVYISQHEDFFEVRPLFHLEPSARAGLAERALARLKTQLRKHLTELVSARRLDELSRFSYAPDLQEKFLELTIPFEKRSARTRLLAVTVPGRLTFFPAAPQLWFQLHRGQQLKNRALEVLTDFYAQKNRQSPEHLSVKRAWTTEIELNFSVPAVPPKPRHSSLLMLMGGAEVGPGWEELENVGRCLDDLYPLELARCLCRQRQVERLKKALSAQERASQLLVGRRKVGKTAVVHALVRDWVESTQGKRKRRYWLVSPQRLISGMSYVGQWESRLLAILRHVEKEDLVVVFDDLLGLFSAGKTAHSDLSVAQVLKPYLQRGQVRVIAEISPSALAVLRERDRGFADLFTLTPLEETTERETLEILLEEMRACEQIHRCNFELSALTTILDLQRRYVRDAAFPGKSAVFLRQLAARHPGGKVDREQVLAHFHTANGVALQILDEERTLERRQVVEELSRQVLGQPQAVEAAADAVALAKSRLADPTRPVSSLLFVGPTGVGKTECAKALARFLFDSEERLLRFDMNEFVSPGSAARLVGTFSEPEGLLTSAVRRRPFCVLLLDELEKAHFDVFNLLLQLLGDGRLSDALGRTVDFTQCIVIMTSNLGVREAGRPIGLRSRSQGESLIYRKAVEDFFPPEFFNRLGRIVPFQRLSREVTAGIASSLINKVLAREGLQRRQCLLEVEPEAMQLLVDAGYHPTLGARALKRTVEKELTGPVAAHLAAQAEALPTRVLVSADDGALAVQVQELQPAQARRPMSCDPAELLRYAQARIQEFESRLAQVAAPALVSDQQLDAASLTYYATQDRLRRVNGIARRLHGFLSHQGPPPRRPEGLVVGLVPDLDGLLSSRDLAGRMAELAESLPTRTAEVRVQSKAVELMAELALLELPPGSPDDRAVLDLNWGSGGGTAGHAMAKLYQELFRQMEFDTELSFQTNSARLSVAGPQADRLVAAEKGLHLCRDPRGLFVLEVGRGSGGAPSVVRVYDERWGYLDLRSGWMVAAKLEAAHLRLLLLGGL